MRSEESKALYKDRAATAEAVHALARNRGRNRLLARGREKVKAVALPFTLTHNVMRAAALAPGLVGLEKGTSAMPQIAG